MPGPYDDFGFDDEEDEGAPSTIAPGLADDFDFEDMTQQARPEAAEVSARDAQPKAEPPAPAPDAPPAEEPAWYESLLSKGAAFAEGLTKSGQLGLHAPPETANTAPIADWIPDWAVPSDQMPGMGIQEQRKLMRDNAARNPVPRMAGELTGDVAAGMLAPGTAGGQAAAGALMSGASEMGRSGDLRKAAGASALGGTVSGVLGAFGHALTGRPAQDKAIKRLITRGGQPEAEAALDRALGGNSWEGTAGSGLDYALQRSRELVPRGSMSGESLKRAAGEAVGQGHMAPEILAARQATPRNFDAYGNAVRNLATDPRGAGFRATDQDQVLQALEQARGNILARSPQAADPLRRLTADAAISDMSTGAPKGLLDAMAGGWGPKGIAARGLMYGAQKAALSPWAGAFHQGLAGAGGGAAGFVGGKLTGPSKASAQDKAYAGAPTLAWTLQSVLSGGDTGLSPEDEQRLTEAVVAGDEQKVFSTDFQLRMRNPAYARRIEEELRSLNGEE